MLIKINFMYKEEVFSFLNKTFTKCAIGFYIFLFLVGYFVSDFKTTISVLGIIALIYMFILIKTIKIKKKYKYYKENSIRCHGTIKDIKVIEGHRELLNTYENRYENVYLIVEYKNPYTNKIEQVTTESVNGNPFIYLSSIDVTVYVLENGQTLVTDFKKINKLTDSVKCQTNEEYKKRIELEENRFKYVFYYIVFFFVIGFLFIKTNFITSFIVILVICVLPILFGNKK